MAADTPSGERPPADTLSDERPPADTPPYGFYTVLAGLGALVVIIAVAIWKYDAADDVTSIINTAGTVIGTIVGAFFGVSVGQAGRKRAEEGKDKAHQEAIESKAALVRVAAKAEPNSEAAKEAVAAVASSP